EPVEVVVEPALRHLGGEEIARGDGCVERDSRNGGKERLVARFSGEDLALGRRAIGIAAKVRVVEVRREWDRSVHEREGNRADQYRTRESPAEARADAKRRETNDRRAERERDHRRAVLVVVGVLATVVRQEQVTERNDRRNEGRPCAKRE